jgi:Tol biopolymer transport system component
MEADSKGDALKPFLLDLKTQQIKKLPLKNQPLFNLEIAPEGARIAFLSYQASESGAGDFRIGIYDIAKESSIILNGVKASRDTTFSWHPNGQQLIYTSKEGMIKSVNIADAKITSMFQGEAPAWSPDGNRLAYRSGSEIRIYDSTNKSTARAYKRNLLQSSMLGRLYWSPDGRYVSFNVAAGLDGKELSYLVLEITSKKSFTSYEGSYWGGAWLNTK